MKLPATHLDGPDNALHRIETGPGRPASVPAADREDQTPNASASRPSPMSIRAAECLLAVVVSENRLKGGPAQPMRPNIAVERIRTDGAEHLRDHVVAA